MEFWLDDLSDRQFTGQNLNRRTQLATLINNSVTEHYYRQSDVHMYMHKINEIPEYKKIVIPFVLLAAAETRRASVVSLVSAQLQIRFPVKTYQDFLEFASVIRLHQSSSEIISRLDCWVVGCRKDKFWFGLLGCMSFVRLCIRDI